MQRASGSFYADVSSLLTLLLTSKMSSSSSSSMSSTSSPLQKTMTASSLLSLRQGIRSTLSVFCSAVDDASSLCGRPNQGVGGGLMAIMMRDEQLDEKMAEERKKKPVTHFRRQLAWSRALVSGIQQPHRGHYAVAHVRSLTHAQGCNLRHFFRTDHCSASVPNDSPRWQRCCCCRR